MTRELKTKLIKIYEKAVKEDSTIELYPVVEAKLTKSQYDDLLDYFTDYILSESIYEYNDCTTFRVTNEDELLEDCPLPDGTIVKANQFLKDGEYIVVLGDKQWSNTLKTVVVL